MSIKKKVWVKGSCGLVNVMAVPYKLVGTILRNYKIIKSLDLVELNKYGILGRS